MYHHISPYLTVYHHVSPCITIPVSVKKHSSGENNMWEDKLSECQIRGWIAVSAAAFQGQGSHKRNDFSQTPVSHHASPCITRIICQEVAGN